MTTRHEADFFARIKDLSRGPEGRLTEKSDLARGLPMEASHPPHDSGKVNDLLARAALPVVYSKAVPTALRDSPNSDVHRTQT